VDKNLNNILQARVIISGRVIMVGFRAACENKAKDLDLKGWVKNMDTKGLPIIGKGKVEAVFEGEKAKVKEMIVWCQKGSALASIDEVKVEWKKATGKFESFEVRY
jgi:acylphosphatase